MLRGDADVLQDCIIVLVAADVVVDAGGQQTVSGAILAREAPADIVLHHNVFGSLGKSLRFVVF